MTERTRRRRPHPAAATRIVVAGAATAGTLGMVAAMAGPLVGSASTSADAVPASLTSVGAETTPAPAVQPAGPPTRIVVVRRHHPVGGSAPAVAPTPSRAAPARVAPAPAVRPAPRPAPVVTKSRGS